MTDLFGMLAGLAQPAERRSPWYCDRPDCDGEPHGPHWQWCDHECPGQFDRARGCSLGCGKGEAHHHTPLCRHARAAQRPPEGNWFIWMLLAGRGFGKSKAAAEWIVEAATSQDPAEWAVVARNATDVRKNARDMTAGVVQAAERRGVLRQYNRHEEDAYLTTGAIIHFVSADKPDRLRGFNLAGAWADELCSWRFASETWDYGLLPALRAGEHPRVVVTTTPKPIPLLKRLVEEAQAEATKPPSERSKVLTTGSTFDNQKNLADNFIAEMRSTYGGTRIGRQELEAELLFDEAGSLVTPELIEGARIEYAELPELQRIVVAVDPAGTYGEGSDETGIIVCAKDREGHGYVLADHSCRRSPHEWASVAAAAYERWQADAIAAEKNMGHDLVEGVIRSVAPHVRYIPIQAALGKRLRAEPITALYEQGRIHHVGVFPQLEEQLCAWTPDAKKSPDRMDALVHGFTELGLAKWGIGQAWLDYYRGVVEKDATTPAPAAPRRAGFLLGESPPPATPPSRCEHRWFPDGDGGHHCARCGAPRPVAV